MRALRILAIGTSALLGCVAVTGCTSSLTYPATAGKAPARPDVSPCPELMGDAVLGVARAAKDPNQEAVVFNLPAGVQSTVWKRVESRLSSRTTLPVRAMTDGDAIVYSVEQIRLNGGKAEVDVLYVDRGIWQLATVKFSGGVFSGYQLDSVTRWVIPVTAPTANDPRPAEAIVQAQAEADREARKAASLAAREAARANTTAETATPTGAEEVASEEATPSSES